MRRLILAMVISALAIGAGLSVAQATDWWLGDNDPEPFCNQAGQGGTTILRIGGSSGGLTPSPCPRTREEMTMRTLKYLVMSGSMFAMMLAGRVDGPYAAPYCDDITAAEYCYPCTTGGATIAWRGSCENLDREWQCVWENCGTSPWIPCTCPGQSGGCDCLITGTPIRLVGGATKLVEAIEVGDRVLSFDQSTGAITETEVVAVQQPFVVDSYYMINESVRVTRTHPFLSRGRWIDAVNLKVGDTVTGDGSERTIYSIQKIEETALAYNFQVASGVYLAAGLVVHNKDICEKFIQYPDID